MAQVKIDLVSCSSSLVNDTQPDERIRKQTGVIPYKIDKEGDFVVLLIESTNSGNWGIPKGKKEKGMSKKQSAEVEAWEEAGIKGKAGIKLGSYTYRKSLTGVLQTVKLYGMNVEGVKQRFPEYWRTRAWFTYEEARKRMPKKMKPFLDKLYNQVTGLEPKKPLTF